MTTDAQNAEKEFDEAWKGQPATGEQPTRDEQTTDEPVDEQVAADQAADAEAPEGEKPDQEDEQTQGDDPEQGQVEDEPEGEQPNGDDELKAQEQSLKERIAALEADAKRHEQEAKTWQGRARKAREEVEKASLTGAVDTVREAQQQAGREHADKRDLKSLTDKQREALRDVFGDDDNVLEALRALAREEAEAAASMASKTIDEVRREAHFTAIAMRHSDYSELAETGALQEWIDTLPYAEGAKYINVMKNGSTSEVIGMLDAYKDATKKPEQETEREPTETKPDPRREKQFAASGGVRQRPGGLPRGKPDPGDFDEAWR